MTHDDGDGRDDDRDDEGERPPKARRERRRVRADAPKEKVLHTRVPAVLDQELKRLAENLRVPVSNVVRAILEDAVDAVDSVGERAEGELMGFVDRLAKQRDELRHRVARREAEASAARAEDGDEGEEADARDEPSACPDAAPQILEGVFGYQPLVLATETACSVCGRALPAGSDAHRALFDEPGKRVFLGPECRLVPAAKESTR